MFAKGPCYDHDYVTSVSCQTPHCEKLAVATGTVPYQLLETLQVWYRFFCRKPLEYGTVSVALYTTDTEPYL